MKKLILFIALMPLICEANIYTSIMSLKRQGQAPIAKDHFTRSFTPGSTYGGGRYTWIEGSNVNVKEFFGMNVKPIGVSSGYWIRSEMTILTPELFGATHDGRKPSQDGVTQAEANSIWPFAVDVSRDTWDWIALRMCCYYMQETASATYGSTAYGGLNQTYKITGLKGIEMPRIKFSTNSRRYTFSFFNFIVDVDSCPNNKAVFNDTVPSTGGDGNLNLERMFRFENITVQSQKAYGKAFQLNESYGNSFKDCMVKGFDTAFIVRFALKTYFIGCESQHARHMGFYVGCSAALADNHTSSGSSQSNSALFIECAAKNLGYNTWTGFELHGVSQAKLTNIIIEGAGGSSTYGFKFNGYDQGFSHVKDVELDGCHSEVALNGSNHLTSLVLVNMVGNYSSVIIRRVYAQGTIDRGLVETAATAACRIYLQHTPYNSGVFKLANKAGTACEWVIGEGFDSYTDYDDNDKWYSVGVGGYTKPQFANSDESINPGYHVLDQRGNQTHRAWQLFGGHW